jgi:hypothetical protein
MKRLALLAALVIGALAPTAASADWTAAGGSLNLSTKDSLRGDSIASISGVPYVAWSEQNTSGVGSVYVKHWNGTKWVQNGGALNIDPSADAGSRRLRT